MRRPFIAGNWKMNLGVSASKNLAEAIAQRIEHLRSVDIAVAPSELSLTTVIQALNESGIHVASQNHSHESKGAFTGEIGPEMLREVGCAYCLIGHSERRTLYGETNEGVHRKVLSAFKAGLLPIICIGETLAERESGQAEEIVQEQLLTAIEGLDATQVAAITIAYEPVWAIGTGKTATPAEA